MYFADPYCAWQKGTNENLNGLLRAFYPKGRNLLRVSPATLKKGPASINAGPKKVLRFRTPQDLFQKNFTRCCISFDDSSRTNVWRSRKLFGQAYGYAKVRIKRATVVLHSIIYQTEIRRVRSKRARRSHLISAMKLFFVRRSFFTFRGVPGEEIALAGKSCLARMCESFGVELLSGAPPAGSKIVLYPAYPFLTPAQLKRYLEGHPTGSLRFGGGYVERFGEAFFAADEPAEGLFSVADLAAARARALRICAEDRMRGGALVEEGAAVEAGVRLARGAVVRAGAVVRGASFVGENAEVGGGSEIDDSEIGAETHVEHSVLKGARVGRRCSVGPFALLRPASEVGDGCRIGDFVELKNARIGRGCKIAHHAYVGDADLGEGVNVGCGAVFVNYDGCKKSRSKVGDGAFIGSNCNLIAPVRVGAGCYVAAGTTVTCDLAADDFCIGRARECVKPDRANKYLPPR